MAAALQAIKLSGDDRSATKLTSDPPNRIRIERRLLDRCRAVLEIEKLEDSDLDGGHIIVDILDDELFKETQFGVVGVGETLPNKGRLRVSQEVHPSPADPLPSPSEDVDPDTQALACAGSHDGHVPVARSDYKTRHANFHATKLALGECIMFPRRGKRRGAYFRIGTNFLTGWVGHPDVGILKALNDNTLGVTASMSGTTLILEGPIVNATPMVKEFRYKLLVRAGHNPDFPNRQFHCSKTVEILEGKTGYLIGAKGNNIKKVMLRHNADLRIVKGRLKISAACNATVEAVLGDHRVSRCIKIIECSV